MGHQHFDAFSPLSMGSPLSNNAEQRRKLKIG